ncbi:RNA-binding protein [Halorubrum sp. CBA1229]|uniref:RNA-binding protein n=1 Tax=Halorubrum sp. CBA1229 TaxID=1853699 RepID=UPI000F3AD0A2|nr:RNA-binding protein [Halorubrum sp. CBA1229]QKY15673.1 RNA-binding protein [Halorubrum sp. CBA1229]
MAKVPFHYVDLRAFSYATEDEKRVEDALRTFLPEDAEIDRVENVGHHGDRIVVLSARIENADGMRHVLDALADLDDVDRVIDELDQRVDDNCALFLRVDKQAAFRGDVRLGPGITVRAKVEAYPAKQEAAVENARETLSRLADDDAAAGDDDAAAGDDDAA